MVGLMTKPELTEEMENDIRHFIEKCDNLNDNDKRELLRSILAKHLHLEGAEFNLTKFNFINIMSKSTKNFVDLAVKTRIQDKELTPAQLPTYCIINATIDELRKEKILKKPVKFKS
jgi:hypothetical protein